MPRLVKRNLIHKERRYIEYVYQEFLRGNGLPTPEQSAKALRYHVQEINYFLLNVKVREALADRGINWADIGGSFTLTAQQIAAAVTMMNFADERTPEEKLSAIGITPEQYYAWLRIPEFYGYVNSLADQNLNHIRPDAVNSLTKLIRNADFQAVKYYLDSTGEFAQTNVTNLQAVLQVVIESIQRHVRDPEVLSAIAAEIHATVPQFAKPSQSDNQFGRQPALEAGSG